MRIEPKRFETGLAQSTSRGGLNTVSQDRMSLPKIVRRTRGPRTSSPPGQLVLGLGPHVPLGQRKRLGTGMIPTTFHPICRRQLFINFYIPVYIYRIFLHMRATRSIDPRSMDRCKMLAQHLVILYIGIYRIFCIIPKFFVTGIYIPHFFAHARYALYRPALHGPL